MRSYPKNGTLIAAKQPDFTEALKKHGLTLSELSRRTGISKSMLSAFASGKKCVSSDTFRKIQGAAPWIVHHSAEGPELCWEGVGPNEWVEFKRRAKKKAIEHAPNIYIKARINEDVLQKALCDKGWTLKDLAEHAGVAVQTLYNVCSGRTYPRMGTVIAISEALDVSQMELFVAVDDNRL